MNIDRIARAMVDVEPPADLEARIRARLEAAPPARTTGWWSWRVGAPVAAAAVIALALVIRGPGSRVQGPEVMTLVGVQGSGSLPAEAAPPGAVAKAGPQVTRSAGLQVRRSAGPQLSAEEIAWMERRMPALDPVTALQIDRLDVVSIQPEPLTITPLTITPVGTDDTGKGAL